MKWRKVLHSLWIDIKCIFYWLFLTYLEVTDNLKYTLAGSVTTSELVNLVFNFIEVYSGRTLYPYQEQFSKRVIRSVLTNDGAEITALFARQSGKSETISDTSGGMMILLPQLANMPMFANDKRLQPFRDGLWIGIFAPSQRQAQITYNRIRSRLLSPSAEAVLNDPDFNLQFTTSNGQTCTLSNGSFVTAISASDGSSIEGESFKLIICEECFVKGTPILTEKGKKNIEDVSVGDKVYSYNHSKKKVELKKVQRSFSQPLYGRKIVTITTKSGKKIVCTDNHKIFVPNKNQYVRADHLTKDDFVLSYIHMPQGNTKGAYERVLQEEEIESIKIKSVDEIEVFDLTIEDNHNFFADTLLVHNCQDISNYKITKSIHPMGAAYNATKVKIGTATTFKGNFYDAIQRNKLEYDNGETRVRNHFEYDCDVAAKYNPWYAKYIEGEKRSLGEKSDEYQMSYKLKWILERGMFIDIEQFEQNNLEPLLDVSLYDKSRTHVAGIDLGGKGDDTVITIVEVDWTQPLQFDERVDPETGETMVYKTYNTYIKSWLKISNMPDYEEQYYMIMDFLSHFKLAKVVCDATREASISHRLRANLNCEVIPYIFTTKSKSEMYKNLETEISSGRARVPASEEVLKSEEYHKFIEQLGELQKDYRGSQLVVSHPDEKNAHDDFCLSLDTEILTDKGFITYDKMTSDTLVASVVDGKIVYRKPTKIIHKDYCGKMYEFKSKDLALKVTENHKMLVKHRNSGCYKDMLSQSLFAMPNEQRYNTLQIPVAPIQDKADYPISDELIKQCGWFITEGWINFDKRYNSKRYCFGQSIKSLKYSEIQAMVKKLGLNPYIYTRKDGLTYWVYHKKDNALFDSLLADGIHRIPRKWLNDFSLRQLRLLLDTLMYGDGTITRNTYHTASYDLARDFQELAHKCGIKTSIRKSGEMYNCYLMQGDCTRIKEVNVTDYNGKVWCVNVDNGYIVTRRNDKIAVTGNCDSWGLAVWGCMDEGVVNETETVNRDSLMGKSRNEQSFYRAISGFTARRRR